MKTTLHISYCTKQYMEGFNFTSFKCDLDGYIYMGEIEIDNPFNAPDQSDLNNAKAESFKAEIKEYKAKINLLENKIKDLFCIESSEPIRNNENGYTND